MATPFNRPGQGSNAQVDDWTPLRRFFRNGGLLMAVWGAVLLVLAPFGITLRKFNSGNVDPYTGAIGVMIFGALIALVAYGATPGGRRAAKWGIRIVVGFIGLLTVALAILLYLHPRGQTPAPAVPGATPLSSPAIPSPSTPPITSPNPSSDAALAQQFGPDQVARLQLTGLSFFPAPDLNHSRMASAIRQLKSMSGATTYVIDRQADSATISFAPVQDLSNFSSMAEISFGPGQADPTTRTVRVKVDPARFPDPARR
jgi:hypothetical protein